MTLQDILARRWIANATEAHDAAARYVCARTRRVLWVEPEDANQRSYRSAPRYLVDNGDGSRTFYCGDDLEHALAKLLLSTRPNSRGRAVHAE